MFNKIFFLAISVALVSCTKDRFPPINPGGTTGEESTIYFWDFNDGGMTNMSVPVVSIGSYQMTYDGVYDYTDGTLLNAPTGAVAGSSLRLRNPAGAYIIRISTLGYEKLKMSYAVMRTNNGAQETRISYSLDGTNYFQAGVTPDQISVGLEFELVSVDFSTINALNNQAQVFIKFDFHFGNTNATGNNRFDNLVFRATNL